MGGAGWGGGRVDVNEELKFFFGGGRGVGSGGGQVGGVRLVGGGVRVDVNAMLGGWG